MEKPKLLLADDNPVLLESVHRLLEPEFEVVALVGDGHALLEAAQALLPDLIVTDISMPRLSGFRAVRRLRMTHPNARILFLTVHDEPAFVTEAMRMGALGYVTKTSLASDLIPAIREVLQGRPFISAACRE